MQFRKLLITASAAALLVYGPVWARQSPANPGSQNPNATTQSPTTQSPATPASPTTTENPSANSGSASTQQNMPDQKEKHWTGSLVDVKCMAKALGSESGSAAPATTSGATPQAPQYMSGLPDQLQQTAQPGGGATPMGPAGSQSRPGTAPTYPGQDSGQNPDMSQAQSQRAAAAAERMDSAAKQCAASTLTQAFGLALSDGKVVQLDSEGNTKASEAIKAVDVQPGKKIKAKVTGVLEANNTVNVASVEVKGKKISPSSSMGGSTGEVK